MFLGRARFARRSCEFAAPPSRPLTARLAGFGCAGGRARFARRSCEFAAPPSRPLTARVAGFGCARWSRSLRSPLLRVRCSSVAAAHRAVGWLRLCQVVALALLAALASSLLLRRGRSPRGWLATVASLAALASSLLLRRGRSPRGWLATVASLAALASSLLLRRGRSPLAARERCPCQGLAGLSYAGMVS